MNFFGRPRMAFRPPGRGPTPPLSYAHDLGQAGLGAGREAGRPCVLGSDVTFSYCCVIVASSNTQLCCVVYHASLPASQFLTHHIAVVCCMLYATTRCPQHTHSAYLYMGSVVGHHTPHARWLGASRQSVLEFQKRSPRRSGLTVA